MLDATSDQILAWSADGAAFEIRDAEALQRDVLPKFFRHVCAGVRSFAPPRRWRAGGVGSAHAIAAPASETNGGTTQARLASFQRQLSLYQFRRAKAAPGAPAPPMSYAHPRFTRDADASALSSVTRAASPKSSPPSSPKAAAPGSAEAPTSPRVRPREANEESALTALFALSGVSSGGGGDAAPVEPKRQKVDEPVRVVG